MTFGWIFLNLLSRLKWPWEILNKYTIDWYVLSEMSFAYDATLLRKIHSQKQINDNIYKQCITSSRLVSEIPKLDIPMSLWHLSNCLNSDSKCPECAASAGSWYVNSVVLSSTNFACFTYLRINSVVLLVENPKRKN